MKKLLSHIAQLNLDAPVRKGIDLLLVEMNRLNGIINSWKSKYNKLKSKYGELKTENEALKAEIEDLKSKGRKNSSNSHRPPSTDGYKKKPKNNRVPSGKKQGAQEGHKGKTLEKSDHVDEVVIHEPDEEFCECGYPLKDAPIVYCNRCQCIDLPDFKFHVTEHQYLSRQCPVCGKIYKAKSTSSVYYGPRLKAFCTYFNHYQLIPFNRVQEMVADLFGRGVSDGFLVGTNKQLAKLLSPFTVHVKEQLMDVACSHADETGARCNNCGQWIHVVCTDRWTYYYGHARRGKEAMEAGGILANYHGTVVHDRFSSYDSFDFTDALCGVHLLRDLRFLFEEKKSKWARKMYDLLLWAKDTKATGNLDYKEVSYFEKRYDLITQTADLFVQKPEKNPPGKRGRPKRSEERRLLDAFLNRKQDILRFLHQPEVPFDNNQAERDLRMIKLQQKISGCFRKPDGRDIFCTNRSYISTLKKHKVDVLEGLALAFNGQPLFT